MTPSQEIRWAIDYFTDKELLIKYLAKIVETEKLNTKLEILTKKNQHEKRTN